MKIPSKVRITSKISYKVKFVKEVDPEYDKKNQDRTLGLCSNDDKTIYLKEGMSQKQTRETFYHELCHAIEFCYGIKIPHQLIYELEHPLERLHFLNKWS